LEQNLHFGADVRNDYGKQKEAVSTGVQRSSGRIPKASGPALIDKGTPIITAILVGLNLIIFLWQGHNDSLVPKGAVSWTDIFREHQYYRLITGMFLHGSTEHIINNMLALFLIGMELEKQIGHRRFLFTYFLTGIAASCASCAYYMIGGEAAYSIGASGAVYGIMGTMLVLMLFQRERGDNSMLVRLGIFALYMFYTIVRSDGSIDHAAHIGGFVAGSVIGVVICILLRRKARKRLLKFRGGKD
jgi:rhomboid protease GluP